MCLLPLSCASPPPSPPPNDDGEGAWASARARLLSAQVGEERAACLAPLLSDLARGSRGGDEGDDLARLAAALAGSSPPAQAAPQAARARCERLFEQGRPISLSGGGTSALARPEGPRLLWALERVSAGEEWGGGGAPSRLLSVALWSSAPLSVAAGDLGLGALRQARRSTWEHNTARAPSAALPERLALSSSAVWLLTFERPAPPRPSHGGWWAHLRADLPLPHPGLSLWVTLPAGWPLAAHGAAPALTRRHAARAERLWRLTPPEEPRYPHALAPLYLSTTPTWPALAAWLWARLGEPPARGGAHALGAEVAAREGGVAGVHAWIRARLRYAPAPLRRFDAAPPAQTLARGAGDCKDLSALAAAALRGAGRGAHIALTALAAPPPSAALLVPSMGWFDHALVWAPTPEERARALSAPPAPPPRARGWLDPTAPAPAPAHLHGRLAWVLLSPAEGRWLEIDAAPLSGVSPTPQ